MSPRSVNPSRSGHILVMSGLGRQSIPSRPYRDTTPKSRRQPITPDCDDQSFRDSALGDEDSYHSVSEGDVEIESQSVLGGKEVVTPDKPVLKTIPRGELICSRDHGFQHTKDLLYEEIAKKQFPAQESELILRGLEKRTDERVRATFVGGIRVSEVSESAVSLKVGMTFMAGADTPQVTRMEQVGMSGKKPEQKDSSWRVHTAGSLLNNFHVNMDLAVVNTDSTAEIMQNARLRIRRETMNFDMRPSNEIARVGRDDRSVTIDSDKVEIVADITDGGWDLESTLIEVDQSSLMNLIVNYRHLIMRGGPDLTFAETKNLLETMIENARRLCIRSPILFRMSTRSHIIKSKNTRYGVDDGVMFRTLTTSTGIKEIISFSASYFNSLDASSDADQSQKLIRPKFLQMLVLLLSLLNDDDLSEIAGFLEATYKLKADRKHVELLILKVLPLRSINSEVFTHAMVTAYEGLHFSKIVEANLDSSQVWDQFVQRILGLGYILPGSINQLGKGALSWIVKYPEDGFKSSTVFNHLQFGGQSRTMNDVPPIDLHKETSLKEATAVLVTLDKYVMDPADLERITCMVQGQYSVTEACTGGRSFDLEISDEQINGTLYEAIRTTNHVIQQLNRFFAGPRRKSVLNRIRGDKDETTFEEVRGSGRLTRNVASLNGDILAVAYKVDGRKITRKDLVRTMSRDLHTMKMAIALVESKVNGRAEQRGGYFGQDASEDIIQLKRCLTQVRDKLTQADGIKSKVERSYVDIGDEPVSKVIHINGADWAASGVWHDYHAWNTQKEYLVYIDAERYEVSRVLWLSDDVIELAFSNSSSKYFVAPLQTVLESERDEEIMVGDVVVLVGQFVYVLEPWDQEHNSEIVANCLKITGIDEASKRRRGMNRTPVKNMVTRTIFR